MSKRLCGIRNFVLSPDERLLGIVAVYPYNIVSNSDDEFHKKNGPQTAGAPIQTKRADDADLPMSSLKMRMPRSSSSDMRKEWS